MQALPLELHSQIFELACTDDGSTAHALACVSRYVQSVAEPYLYQSLAIAGLAPLTALLARLERTPVHKRRIRRLFLSDWSHKQVRQKSAPTADADMDRYDLEQAAVMRLLVLAAPTLHTLTLLVSCPFTSTALIGNLFALPLPHLRELSVHGFYPFPHLPNVMPRLTHLSLSGNRNPHGLLQVGALGEACPRVETLHVSGLVSAASFAEELEHSLIPEAASGTFRSALPPRIREVVVRAGPAPAKVRRYHTAAAQDDKMLAHFAAIDSAQGADNLRGVRFVLVEEHNDDVFVCMKHGWART